MNLLSVGAKSEFGKELNEIFPLTDDVIGPGIDLKQIQKANMFF